MQNQRMAHFADRRGRIITLTGGRAGRELVASHDGQRIGHLAVDLGAGAPQLRSLEIDGGYRRAGIGSALVRQTIERHGVPLACAPFNQLQAGTPGRLSDDGLAFMVSMIGRRWVNPTSGRRIEPAPKTR